MVRSIGLILLFIAVAFMLITDNMIKKGRFLEVKSVLVVKVIGSAILFVSLGFLIASA